jgi:hypothetical protein
MRHDGPSRRRQDSRPDAKEVAAICGAGLRRKPTLIEPDAIASPVTLSINASG